MAVALTHTTVATGTDAGNAQIGKTQWNETHTLEMATARLLGRTTAGTGAVEEISAGSGLSLSAGSLDVSGTASLNINGTVGATTPNTGDFTAITSTSASGILTRAAATQDGIALVGRAGGTGSWTTSLTTGTLTANRTVLFPNANINFTTGLNVNWGGTGLTSGTSGGIPYYSATTTMASSGVLAANALMVGGGAGAGPSTVTTGTGVVTALGVNTGTAGAFVVNGGALGTPSSGTVTNLTGTASININGTVGATTANTGAFTSVTSTSASGILTRAAATQDGVELIGRAGGTASYKVTFTPTTLTASRTITLPDANINFTTGLGVAQGGTGLTSGTSGGVLYYSASGTLASSAALAASSLVVGGGAGVAPSTITTGTGVTTALGVNTGTAGAFVVNGGALGTPSSGTVTNLTGTASININGTVGATTPDTGAFTTLSASSTVSGTGFSTYLASPPAIGGTTPAAGSFTSLTATNAAGVVSRAAATQDGVALVGRAGGTSSYEVSLTPTTLTADRTITLPDAAGVAVLDTATQTLTNKTLTDPAITGAILEDVFTISDGVSVDIDPGNGTIQLWTLGASRTPTATNFLAGESVTLMIDDGTAYTVTWTTIGVVWVGGTAPTLATTGRTVIELWKVSTTVYGALVGSVA